MDREKPSKAAPGPVSDLVCPSDPSKPLTEPEALDLTHTTEAQRISTGKGVRVAFLADGIDPNNADFIRPDGSHVFIDYQDFSGEGPFAPTAGGEAFGDAELDRRAGPPDVRPGRLRQPRAPAAAGLHDPRAGHGARASLVGLKVFPAGGFAFNSSVLEALDYAVTADHVDVINESFGSNQFPDTNDDPTALFNEELVRAGIVSPRAAATPATTTRSARRQLARGHLRRRLDDLPQLRADHRQRLPAEQREVPQQRDLRAELGRASPSPAGRSTCWLRVTSAGRCAPTDVDMFQNCFDNKDEPSPIQQFGGTSQSAPLTAGAAALVIQAYRDSHHGASPTPTWSAGCSPARPRTSACRPRCRVPACSTRWPR